MRRERQLRTIRLVGVSSSGPTEIPPEAGIEIHDGIPGWQEVEPGVWQNEAGGRAYGRYYLVTDPSQWGDLSQCAQDDSGQWYCLESAYRPVVREPTTITETTPPPVTDTTPPPTTTVPPIIETQTPPPRQDDLADASVTPPALPTTAAQADPFPWWLLLVLAVLWINKDKK